GDIEAVTAVERSTDVRAVSLRLEAVAGSRFASWASLRHGDLRGCLERVRDRAAGGVAVVGERAGAAGAEARRVVREVGRAGRAFRDRVRLAGRQRDVEAVAAGQCGTDVGSVALDLEAVTAPCRTVRARLGDRHLRLRLERVGDRAA